MGLMSEKLVTWNIVTNIDFGPNISQLILALDESAYQRHISGVKLLHGPNPWSYFEGKLGV